MSRNGEGEQGAYDMSHVICALGSFFLFLLYLTELLFVLGTMTNYRQTWRGEIGLKQHVACHLCQTGTLFYFINM